MLVLPTSTTSRLDIATRLTEVTCRAWLRVPCSRRTRALHDDQLAGADGDHFAAVAQLRAALIVDADPRPARAAVADHGGDAIARFVNGVRAPLGQHGLPVDRSAQARVEVLDELLGRGGDAVEFLGDFADGDRVRPGLVLDRLDVDADSHEDVRAIVLHARLDQDAGDFFAADEDVVRPFDFRIDGKYIT